MKSWRTDKFKVGDVVTILEEYSGQHGAGPHVVTKIFDREFVDYNWRYGDDYTSYGTNWSSMGHTQHVLLDCSINDENYYSGACLEPLKTPEDELP